MERKRKVIIGVFALVIVIIIIIAVVKIRELKYIDSTGRINKTKAGEGRG